MAEKWKAALKKGGPSAVGMFGSGQWTIWEGYAAAKLYKAGFRSNNLDPNARHCMASAVAGFMRTFGIDEPMGCYDDIEHADAFVLWGSNMAEMHPILWSRLTDRRLTHPGCKVHVLSTFEHRSLRARRQSRSIFKPQTRPRDPQLHLQLHHPEQRGEHRISSTSTSPSRTGEDIGYGLRPDHPLEEGGQRLAQGRARTARKDPAGIERRSPSRSSRNFVAQYTLDYAAKLSGVPKEQLEELAKLYADPKKKVVSYWTMGFNQHTRGTWVNNMIYNVHLLAGKISEPGNGPFSLTGQPSACGTAREVGTFAHRLPADMVVTNPEAPRGRRRRSGSCPKARSPARSATTPCRRAACSRTASSTPTGRSAPTTCRPGPTSTTRAIPGWRNPDTFIVVSDAYPTVTALAADLILPSAMWMEKEGAYGNAERRTPVLAPAGQGAGRGALRPVAVRSSSPSASRSRRSGRPN